MVREAQFHWDNLMFHPGAERLMDDLSLEVNCGLNLPLRLAELADGA